jgi:hypothetical protein
MYMRPMIGIIASARKDMAQTIPRKRIEVKRNAAKVIIPA